MPSESFLFASAFPASFDPNERNDGRLKALSIVLQTKDHPDSAFSRMKFKGTHPNPIYKPNAFKAEKGQDGRHISSYYRYAVKDEVSVRFVSPH